MSNDPTPSPRAYALYRLLHPEAGQNAAAEAVGYAGGRPGEKARRIYERVLELQETPEIVGETDNEIARLRAEIQRAKHKLHLLQKKKKAQDEWKLAAQVIREAETKKPVSS